MSPDFDSSQPLENIKHEHFAQSYVNGKAGIRYNVRKSYVEAGYAGGTSNNNAYRLMDNDAILARIHYLESLNITENCLTIAEKRAYCAQVVRSDAPLRMKLAFLELDSKLAGHYAPAKTEINLEMSGDINVERCHRVYLEAQKEYRQAIGLPTVGLLPEANEPVGKDPDNNDETIHDGVT